MATGLPDGDSAAKPFAKLTTAEVTCVSHRRIRHRERVLLLPSVSRSGVEGDEWKFNRRECSWHSQKNCISAVLPNDWGWGNLC